jgi:hypothetical protein
MRVPVLAFSHGRSLAPDIPSGEHRPGYLCGAEPRHQYLSMAGAATANERRREIHYFSLIWRTKRAFIETAADGV